MIFLGCVLVFDNAFLRVFPLFSIRITTIQFDVSAMLFFCNISVAVFSIFSVVSGHSSVTVCHNLFIMLQFQTQIFLPFPARFRNWTFSTTVLYSTMMNNTDIEMVNNPICRTGPESMTMTREPGSPELINDQTVPGMHTTSSIPGTQPPITVFPLYDQNQAAFKNPPGAAMRWLCPCCAVYKHEVNDQSSSVRDYV